MSLDSIKVFKILCQQIRLRCYKTLGTFVIYSPMSTPSLKLSGPYARTQFCWRNGPGRWGTLVHDTSPSSFIITFPFCVLTIFVTLIKFLIGWFIKLSVRTFQPLIVINRRVILCNSIGDIHKFIVHCLIPLHPW